MNARSFLSDDNFTVAFGFCSVADFFSCSSLLMLSPNNEPEVWSLLDSFIIRLSRVKLFVRNAASMRRAVFSTVKPRRSPWRVRWPLCETSLRPRAESAYLIRFFQVQSEGLRFHASEQTPSRRGQLNR